MNKLQASEKEGKDQIFCSEILPPKNLKMWSWVVDMDRVTIPAMTSAYLDAFGNLDAVPKNLRKLAH